MYKTKNILLLIILIPIITYANPRWHITIVNRTDKSISVTSKNSDNYCWYQNDLASKIIIPSGQSKLIVTEENNMGSCKYNGIVSIHKFQNFLIDGGYASIGTKYYNLRNFNSSFKYFNIAPEVPIVKSNDVLKNENVILKINYNGWMDYEITYVKW